MIFGSNGIVTNQFGQILLIRRDDTRTFAPPGGGVEAGELPTENVVREVLEETGLKVHPVRLVGLYHFAWGTNGALAFSLRCLENGGELKPSPESPQVGFFPSHDLPRPMAPLHRERLQRDITHAGGPPYWGTQTLGPTMRLGKFLLRQVVYRWKDWQRRRRGVAPFVPAPDWQTGACVVLRNEVGTILWLKETAGGSWRLPGGDGLPGEPPWTTAVRQTQAQIGRRPTLTDLSGVYVYRDTAHALFTFTAPLHDERLTPNAATAEFAYFMPGEEPANALPRHVERVADAVGDHVGAVFRRQERV